MMKKIKTYLPMILSILFFGVYSFLISVILKGADEIINDSYMIIFIMLGIIILFFIEWICFVVHAARNKNLKDKALWAVLIYLFNVFIIPYYNFKYAIGLKNIKKNMIIYISLSIVAIIMGIIFPLSIKENVRVNKYFSHDKKFEFTLYGNYDQRNDSNYDMYASDNNRQIHIGAFINEKSNSSITSDYILEYRKSWLFSTRNNVRLIESKKDELEDKIISSDVYYGEMGIAKTIYKISTIEYIDENYIIEVIQTTYHKDYDKVKKELEQILVDVKLLK